MVNVGYTETHTGTLRYKCKSTRKGGYPVHENGNYESLLSFQALPDWKTFKGHGRKWKYTRNYQPVMDRILLDIDCEDLNTAYEVMQGISSDLEAYNDCINIYFSGSKGFHIEILTEELDIIDTTAERPMNSCKQYVEFLNYFMGLYPQVDLSLKDVGTRIIRIHHTKHEKTGNYKILIDTNADLEAILSASRENMDMTAPCPQILSEHLALQLLQKYRKPILVKAEDNRTEPVEPTSSNIIIDVYNDLVKAGYGRHDICCWIGAGLNGYLQHDKVRELYGLLKDNTDIESSTNAEQSLMTAFEKDSKPCNLGALFNKYKEQKIDFSNLKSLVGYLEHTANTGGYEDFTSLLRNYSNDWFSLLDNKLYDYTDNTRNLFIGLINSLSALMGYGSRLICVNGGAEMGKSEYVLTIQKLLPEQSFINLGSSTPASIRRQPENKYNRRVCYLGDKGLKGKDDEEFTGIYEVFGALVTDKEFRRDLYEGGEVKEFKLKSDGLCVFYTEPYTNLRLFGAGDQYMTRTSFITINPVKDGLKIFLLDENNTNTFYALHSRYIQYLLNNPIDLKLSVEVQTRIYNASKGSLRTAKYVRGLFMAYCQYLQINEPTITNVKEFLQVFQPLPEVTQIELEVYQKLHDNLNILTPEDLLFKVTDSGDLADYQDLLLSRTERKKRSFFTAKQIKTYFKQDLQGNKNLKDSIDYIPEILANLFNAGYIERLDWQHQNQNVYYFLEKGEENTENEQ